MQKSTKLVIHYPFPYKDMIFIVSFKSWNAVQLGVDAEVRVNFLSLDISVSTCNFFLMIILFFYGYYVRETVMTIVKPMKMF